MSVPRIAQCPSDCPNAGNRRDTRTERRCRALAALVAAVVVGAGACSGGERQSSHQTATPNSEPIRYLPAWLYRGTHDLDVTVEGPLSSYVLRASDPTSATTTIVRVEARPNAPTKLSTLPTERFAAVPDADTRHGRVSWSDVIASVEVEVTAHPVASVDAKRVITEYVERTAEGVIPVPESVLRSVLEAPLEDLAGAQRQIDLNAVSLTLTGELYGSLDGGGINYRVAANPKSGAEFPACSGCDQPNFAFERKRGGHWTAIVAIPLGATLDAGGRVTASSDVLECGCTFVAFDASERTEYRVTAEDGRQWTSEYVPGQSL